MRDSLVRAVATHFSGFAIIMALLLTVFALNNYNAQAATPTLLSSDSSAVDGVLASVVAAQVAETTNLPIAANAANLSTSLIIRDELTTPKNPDSVTKDQVLQPLAGRSRVIIYTAATGDSVKSVASRFQLTENTIKWANDLTNNNLKKGQKIKILPVNGVNYKVQRGDKLDEIAKKYKVDPESIIAYNNLESVGIKSGQMVIIPGGALPEVERPGYVAPVQTYASPQTYNFGTSYATGWGGQSQILYVNRQSTSAGNRNVYGNCTWFVWEYRKSAGRQLPSAALGNANLWHISLGGAGYRVDRSPAVGSIMQTSAGGGGYGHVAVVVKVNSDGSIRVREMNYAGYNVVSERVIAKNQVGLYNYIH